VTKLRRVGKSAAKLTAPTGLDGDFDSCFHAFPTLIDMSYATAEYPVFHISVNQLNYLQHRPGVATDIVGSFDGSGRTPQWPQTV